MAKILIITEVKVETPCSTRGKGLWESAETQRKIHPVNTAEVTGL